MRLSGATTVLTGLALAAALGAGAATAANAPARGGPFGAGNAPIDISADELEVRDSESRAIWKGNVEAIQGQNRLRTPMLSIYYAQSGTGGQAVPGAGGGSIQRMEAEGPVYYVTPQQNARGDHAVYDAASATVTMTGNVVLVQDKNVVQGERLVIDTNTNKATLVATAQGRGASGRVRGVFYPNQNQAPSQSPSGTARP
jgi:lipopolysaccharide export system protein LptA